MSTALLIDNWTLQDVERLFGSGLSQRVTAEISIPTDGSAHRFDPVLAGVLELDALLTLVTNRLVLGNAAAQKPRLERQ